MQSPQAIPAFASPLSLSLLRPTLRSANTCSPLRAPVSAPRRARISMVEEESVSLTDGKADTAAILSEMRSSIEAEGKIPRTLNTGVTRDADGKSNVWAVEPSQVVDEGPEVNKLAILGAVFAAVAVALVVLPNLPFVNADQF